MYKVKYLCPRIKYPPKNNKFQLQNISNYEKNYLYASYFIINCNNLDNKQEIKVCFKLFNSTNRINQSISFFGNNALELSYLLLSHKIVNLSLLPNHAIYLGMELMKIEVALLMNQSYIQN
jgi:Domain of unknown function (DUF4346)|uniref:DUF4346 domain-containing protein n=1 Tax=Thorea hispida TaxID=202687 RepID=A0A1C9CAE1_9FLOR|nr:hypothetical protein Thor_070 [Thorea hispida]AOM65362.1 hypothetical protein Thor_070 [Thorea hispida]ARX95924.1 unknown orf [Thorea hispida]UNJ79069.1 hypothetical protein [Thorea hispida]